MIKFYFIGNPHPSINEQENAKKLFTLSLGNLKEEFENNDGEVKFDYSIPQTSNSHCTFTYNLDISDFVRKWNEQTQKKL